MYMLMRFLLLLTVHTVAGQPLSLPVGNWNALGVDSLRTAPADKVWVVAHRGDWRNAPENSVQAIKNCIKMGVDIVEIDVQLTKDGHAVLMHDETIDRTTTGKGYVRDWTLDSLQRVFLKDGLGVPTQQHVPTLVEVLQLCKDKILINLDKGYDLFPLCYDLARQTGTLQQIIFKTNKPYQEVRDKLGAGFDEVHFMPIINLNSSGWASLLDGYLSHYKPIAIEFSFADDRHAQLAKFKEYRQAGIAVWANALWPKQNGGHDDERAANDPAVYRWFLDHAVNVIQTDRPQLLIDYLKEGAR